MTRAATLAPLAAFACGLVACGGAHREAAWAPNDGVWERGLASYYADSLSGHRTASGEPYDPGAPTCAHRALPFGTWVEVARADGRRVRVRVNDRGPFVWGRVIDLSRAAARDLGMLRAGTVEVWIRPVGRAGP